MKKTEKTNVYYYLMLLKKNIDRLKEEEDEINEGAITDEEYEELMFLINKILKTCDLIK